LNYMIMDILVHHNPLKKFKKKITNKRKSNEIIINKDEFVYENEEQEIKEEKDLEDFLIKCHNLKDDLTNLQQEIKFIDIENVIGLRGCKTTLLKSKKQLEILKACETLPALQRSSSKRLFTSLIQYLSDKIVYTLTQWKDKVQLREDMLIQKKKIQYLQIVKPDVPHDELAEIASKDKNLDEVFKEEIVHIKLDSIENDI